MLDFPNPPLTVGQTFNSGSGAIYVWDGVAWSIATSQTATALPKNLIANPSMQISQENGNTPVAAQAFPADQWVVGASGLTQNGVRSQGYASPNNSPNAVATSFSVAKASLAASDYGSLYQFIEGQFCAELQWGTAKAIPAVLRFNAACETAGTYTVALVASGTDYSWCGSFTCDGTTNLKTFVFPIPAQVAGTFAKDNTAGMRLWFTYACGTQFGGGVAGWQSGYKFSIAGMTNGAAVINKNMIITDVGLYPDPSNTGLPPPFTALNYAEDLMRCMRYFWKGLPFASANYGSFVSGAIFTWPVAFHTKMRVTPSLNSDFTGITLASCTAPTVGAASLDGLILYSSSTTVNSNVNFTFAAGNYIAASARM